MRPEHEAIQNWLEAAAVELNLGDWVIHFDPADCDDDAEAMVRTTETQHAYFRVCPEFWDFSPGYRRHVLAHELCHLYTTRIREFAESLHACLSKQTAAFAEDMLYRAEEHVVESFARIVSNLLPDVERPPGLTKETSRVTSAVSASPKV